MSLATTEMRLRKAKDLHSQDDVNLTIIRVAGELIRGLKNMENETHGLRRSINRRF